MMEVYLLQHVHLFEHGTEDVKVIGIYANRADAEAAIARLSTQPGFRDSLDTFCISAYLVGDDHWLNGYAPGKTKKRALV
jgi:hypothetical protein